MASRWVDSGIDWANLDLYKDRQSWVIDELYRAFKERQAVYSYSKDITTSVDAWDFNHSLRDYEKINEIITEFQEWLTTDDYTIWPSNQRNRGAWQDFTIDSTGDSVQLSLPYRGIPFFTLTALGSLETLVGSSLAPIRDWTFPNNYRIDGDLLALIYNILINLKTYCPYFHSGFGSAPNRIIGKTMFFDQDFWTVSGTDWNDTETNYIADTLANTAGVLADGGDAITLSLDAETLDIQHSNTFYSFDFMRDSSDNVILGSNTNTFGYKYRQQFAGIAADFPGFVYDVFTKEALTGSELSGFSEAHPYSFIEPTPRAFTTATLLMVLDMDNSSIIEYYTP